MENVTNNQGLTKDEQITKAMSSMEDMLTLVRRVIDLLEDSLSSLDVEITEHNMAVEDFLEKACGYLERYIADAEDNPGCEDYEHYDECHADDDGHSAFLIYTEDDGDGTEPMTALMCDPNMGIAEVKTQSIPQLLRLYSASPKFDRSSIPCGKLMLVYHLTSDYDPKLSFDIEKYMKHRLRLKKSDMFTVIDGDALLREIEGDA